MAVIQHVVIYMDMLYNDISQTGGCMYDLTMHIEEKLRIAEHKLKMINNELDRVIAGGVYAPQLHAERTGITCTIVTLKELLVDLTTLSTNQESFIIGKEEFVRL